MDSDVGLYVVKKDDKFGVIDLKGNEKIYIENDEIGIDISKFSQNNIKNKYILADGLIPVKNGEYWGLYDTNGEQLTPFQYDSLGYIASSNKEAINLLVIPKYNVLVACQNKKYTLINPSGQELFPAVADDIYMSISNGQTYYYITVNDKKFDLIEYLDSNGIITTGQDENEQNNEQNVGGEEQGNEGNVGNGQQEENQQQNQAEGQEEQNSNDQQNQSTEQEEQNGNDQ